MVLFSRLWQRSFKIGRRVALCSSRGNSISKNLPGNSPDPVCRFKSPPAFYPAKNSKQFRRFDLIDRAFADPWE
jgi:hypothetical protein